jgi:hypothetical protein
MTSHVSRSITVDEEELLARAVGVVAGAETQCNCELDACRADWHVTCRTDERAPTAGGGRTNRFEEVTPVGGAGEPATPDDGLAQLQGESTAEEYQSARGDVRGTPSWPIVSSTAVTDAAPPPVGMNWANVADRIGVDVGILEHDGCIVLAGEYVPAPGFVVDPSTFLARSARTGDRVLRHSYFIGEITASEFGLKLSVDPDSGSVPNAVVRTTAGPIIGLFQDSGDAERARRQIMEGSIGYGVSVQQGPLGTELRVARTENAGGVASVMASHHGAVISAGGVAL